MVKNEPIRLQKFLAQCGVASRRKAEELIVNSIANNIANMMLSNHSNLWAIESGCGKIAEAIMNHR